MGADETSHVLRHGRQIRATPLVENNTVIIFRYVNGTPRTSTIPQGKRSSPKRFASVRRGERSSRRVSSITLFVPEEFVKRLSHHSYAELFLERSCHCAGNRFLTPTAPRLNVTFMTARDDVQTRLNKAAFPSNPLVSVEIHVLNRYSSYHSRVVSSGRKRKSGKQFFVVVDIFPTAEVCLFDKTTVT